MSILHEILEEKKKAWTNLLNEIQKLDDLKTKASQATIELQGAIKFIEQELIDKVDAVKKEAVNKIESELKE